MVIRAPQTCGGARGSGPYRQVVAAVAADQGCFAVAVGLLGFGVQAGETQHLKAVEELNLLLLREGSWNTSGGGSHLGVTSTATGTNRGCGSPARPLQIFPN